MTGEVLRKKTLTYNSYHNEINKNKIYILVYLEVIFTF